MFSGGNQYALLHQTGGVAYLGNVAADGFDFEAVKVGPAENNTGSG